MFRFIKRLFGRERNDEKVTKVLYVTANPKPEADSYSLSTGREFIDLYKKNNPNDEVIEIDVFKANIPLIDADVLNAWGELQHGKTFDELDANVKDKVGRIDQFTNQFISADKYVFVTPLWNLSIPPLMKAYIDTITVAGKTFKYTENGPVGLLKNKKAVHIHAAGGVYSEGPAAPFEHANTYIKSILGFLGVESIDSILIEATAQADPGAEAVKSKASERVKEVVKNF
ncbi:FMN-dependent NADH-azoreductase [Clostridium cylindrosporum]|uniref:FMN dependent NADH:quinone oxidoreductase n=1 Tax=Clostridium cylindrosporum DSM 605 TaxID=1121307 RepID=A0A0J8D9G4_CLOCY|nr:FMN-dependent NADH-azoreductase [Clostridium cylindrosporum]KMT22492.1 FMN-dependent NADH-azoreductase AzoR [Clostridium cylindrosporum DSM 605]